ncbi:hypothetical protein NDU88_001322 [Pleurodeles waltl]|uniref:Uncharacterized protein n=1 Tax=Pleurodeles waltl TaxID=8319 RepID=A0AAV7MKL0_PLEWA|nr:hypothetical protein NDU88_001322 [Pleurodeles waltl]
MAEVSANSSEVSSVDEDLNETSLDFSGELSLDDTKRNEEGAHCGKRQGKAKTRKNRRSWKIKNRRQKKKADIKVKLKIEKEDENLVFNLSSKELSEQYKSFE